MVLTLDHIQTQERNTYYKWIILTLSAFTHTFVVALPVMCMPVLFDEISVDLGLSLVQIGTIWGMGALPVILMGTVGGVLGDRYGTKRILRIFCLLTGIGGAMRGFSNGFISLTSTTLLLGFLFPVIPINIPKTCGVWFPRHQLGFANGVVSMGMALGFMAGSMLSATVLSPLLGGWRNVLFFYGFISILFSGFWHFTRSSPGSESSREITENHASSLETFRHLVRVKNIWLLGFTILGIGGCVQGMLGYLPLYLREIGWSGPMADNALGAFHGVSMTITLPIAILSDRIGLRKNVLIIAAIMIIAGTGLLSIADGLFVWVAVIMTGMVRDGFMAIFLTTIIETRGVGVAYAGTGMGLVMIFSGLGNLISPPFGNSLAHFNPGLPFIFWALLGLAGLCSLCFVNEN